VEGGCGLLSVKENVAFICLTNLFNSCALKNDLWSGRSSNALPFKAIGYNHKILILGTL
jgi:hypothetical protein